MKALVVKPFICKETKEAYNIDYIYEGTKKRVSALQKLGYLAEIPEEETAKEENPETENPDEGLED